MVIVKARPKKDQLNKRRMLFWGFS